MISDVREINRMANQSENWVSEGHAVGEKHAANEETRGAGVGSAARDAPLSSRVVGLGGTACWPAGRSVLIDSFGLASSAMARVVALPNGLFRGVLHELSRGSRKSGTANFLAILFWPTGPTECSCTPSNLSELVELVNCVTEIHCGKYNKADHEKSRIRATANLSSCVGAPWSSQTPSPTPRAYPRRRRHTRS